MLCRPASNIKYLNVSVNAIDWDSDIVPTQEELETAKNDALSQYFGHKAENGKLFRSYTHMMELVGEHVDVPLKQ